MHTGLLLRERCVLVVWIVRLKLKLRGRVDIELETRKLYARVAHAVCHGGQHISILAGLVLEVWMAIGGGPLQQGVGPGASTRASKPIFCIFVLPADARSGYHRRPGCATGKLEKLCRKGGEIYRPLNY